MSDIEALEQRITAALDRVKQGLDAAASRDGTDAEGLAALQQDLADEKLAGEQLEARLKSVLEKQQSESEAAETAQKERDEAVTKLDAELQSLRQANQQLRENNQALREANAAGLADAEQINKAMQSELEALRADHAAGRAEAGAVLADLEQLISQSTATTEVGDA
jgi:predicted RNase H-like nuclease (RuvC/YqgF family)